MTEGPALPRKRRGRIVLIVSVIAVLAAATGLTIYWVKQSSGSSPQVVLPITGLEGPRGVAVDQAGTVYAANSSTIVSFVPQSNTQVTWHARDDDDLYGPAISRDRTVYVADYSHDRIIQFHPGSKTPTVVPIARPKSVATPQAVAVDQAGNLYITDGLGYNVEKITPGSGVILHLPLTGLRSSYGVAVDNKGNVYVADSGNNRVIKLAKWSQTQSVMPFTGLSQPWGIAVDNGGNVYVCDRRHNRVLKLAAGAKTPITLPFKGLNYPSGVAVDRETNVYVADYYNDRVLKLPAGS